MVWKTVPVDMVAVFVGPFDMLLVVELQQICPVASQLCAAYHV